MGLAWTIPFKGIQNPLKTRVRERYRRKTGLPQKLSIRDHESLKVVTSVFLNSSSLERENFGFIFVSVFPFPF